MNKESVKTLQGNLDILVTKYNSLISGNNFNEALNVMKNIDAVTRELQYIGENVMITDTKIKNVWYDVLKFFVDTKQSQLIQLDYTSETNSIKHRATGKTTALVRLSNDYNIPIYTNKRHSSTLKDRAKELNVNANIVDDLRTLNMVQYRNKGIVLVDELTDISDINRDAYTVIGFQCNTNK